MTGRSFQNYGPVARECINRLDAKLGQNGGEGFLLAQLKMF